MVLKSLVGVESINGEEVVDIVAERELFEKNLKVGTRQDGINFNQESWNEYFERRIRPNRFIYFRTDVNSLSFNIQKGNREEVGVNGCTLKDIASVLNVLEEGLVTESVKMD